MVVNRTCSRTTPEVAEAAPFSVRLHRRLGSRDAHRHDVSRPAGPRQVAIASTCPTDTGRFVRRTPCGSFGASRLAAATGAPVVVLTSTRRAGFPSSGSPSLCFPTLRRPEAFPRRYARPPTSWRCAFPDWPHPMSPWGLTTGDETTPSLPPPARPPILLSRQTLDLPESRRHCSISLVYARHQPPEQPPLTCGRASRPSHAGFGRWPRRWLARVSWCAARRLSAGGRRRTTGLRALLALVTPAGASPPLLLIRPLRLVKRLGRGPAPTNSGDAAVLVLGGLLPRVALPIVRTITRFRRAPAVTWLSSDVAFSALRLVGPSRAVALDHRRRT